MTKRLTEYNLNPAHLHRLGAVLDACWEHDTSPGFPVSDQELAGTAMLLDARMLVALKNQLDYFKLPQRTPADFVIRFKTITECEVSAKTVEEHVRWLQADGTYEQDAVFEDTEEWAQCNYDLLSYSVGMTLCLVGELDKLVKGSGATVDASYEGYLIPSVLIKRVADPSWLALPTLGRAKYMLTRRFVKKLRFLVDTAGDDFVLPS
jgi:hypothetical protein